MIRVSIVLLILTVCGWAGQIPSARYVKISLPETGRVLTLAEVEVISGGENVASTGQASQSSKAGGGVAKRAIDGNTSGDWSKGGQTHTKEGDDQMPWWELDLGREVPVEKVQIWNRRKYESRLDGFTLEFLNENKERVWEESNLSGPHGSVAFVFEGNRRKVVEYGWNGKIISEEESFNVPSGYRDPLPFQFRGNERVAIIGNGLADRMQHDGWLEAYLQTATAGQKIAFRNMAISGDQVGHYPRSKGFQPMGAYLRQVQADVIFAFFGYNESFSGKEGLSSFKNEVEKMIGSLRGSRPAEEGIPRIVLFGPTAVEDLENRYFPDGLTSNQNLREYTLATKEVAEKVGVEFVDLYGPTAKMYELIGDPLTINGVHLNERGNRELARAITESLLGATSVDEARLEETRQAVLEKNWHWHNRYRATDGNDVWGGRSKLRFVNDQSNAEVLQHELTMLDVMTANRDPLIWAKAKGEDYQVNDENVPSAMEVISNVGGKSRGSNPEKEGGSNYVSGKDGLKLMTVPEGFEVNLFADEERFPELANPVQMQVDGKGRLWVAAWATYPKWEPFKEMDDALLILPDDDGDGVADRVIEFARVHNPQGFEFWNGGVLVTSQPDLLFLKDTDGDDVADVREVILSGFGSADTHHAANNLILGPGGGLFWQSGIYLQNNFEHPWGTSLESRASGLYRFDPRRHTVSLQAKNGPNPHGISFDEWGYQFATDGTSGRASQIRPHESGFKMHKLLEKEVRPVPANEVVASSNFPDEMQGDFLICNTIGFLGIKRYKLHRDGFGEDFGLGEIWGEPEGDLLISEDKNFRPTDAVFGQDGALYVSDWHNVIIGHMQHSIRDPKRDKNHGRVYRIHYKEKPLQKPVAIDGQPVAGLLENFRNPVFHVRHRTRVELSERDESEVIPLVKKWADSLDESKKEEGPLLLEALWLHQQFDVRDQGLLARVLASAEPHVVKAAEVVQHYWEKADPVQNVVQQVIEQEEEKLEFEIPAHLSADEKEQYVFGGEVYHREGHCVTCHQTNGAGMSNIYPPLTESRWVTGDEERLIKLTMHGLWGRIEVNGKVYDPDKGVPPMTAFKSLLDDHEMAAVLTFIRNSWGNRADAIEESKVTGVRKSTKGQTTFYNPAELLKEHPMKN